MPATVTHAFFAKDVFEIIPEDINKYMDIEKCKMFGQSMDSLYFYNLFSVLPGKKVRSFQNYFHFNNSQEFFINVLRYMRDNEIRDVDACSFLLGAICHYALDSTVHPFIVYKTGWFDKKKPSTYKYNNIHTFMETFIDNDMIRRRFKVNPYEFDVSEFCFNIEPFSNGLNKTLDYAFYNTFKFRDMSKIYYKSLKQMRNSIKLFRMDPKGTKKFMYKVIDSFTTRSTFRFEAISYNYPLEDKHNFLNVNHNIWRNPCVYDMTSDESFVDLYLKSIKLARVLVCASFDYLNGKDIDLEQIFDNSSYVTGLKCDDKKELKYFEF